MKGGARRAVLAVAGLGLLALAGSLAGGSGASAGRSLLGPLGPPLAQAQFVRARLARDAGLEGRSLALLHAGLDLDPGSLSGRLALANHMGLTLSSVEGGRSGVERLAWLQEALAVLEEGPEEHAAERAFHAGVLLMSHAETDPDLPWAGGTPALWRAAAERFHHAEGLGHPEGGVAEAFVLRQLDEATRE